MDSVRCGIIMSAHSKNKVKSKKDKPPKSSKVNLKSISFPKHPPTENFVGEIEID